MIIGKIGAQLKESPELKIVLFSYDDVAKLVKDNYVLIVVIVLISYCLLF